MGRDMSGGFIEARRILFALAVTSFVCVREQRSTRSAASRVSLNVIFFE
jgi:hypothetical protein